MITPTYNNKWIRKFMRLAREGCESTSCGSRNVGCLLVKNKIPIMSGYNGPPSGCKNNSERVNISNDYAMPSYNPHDCTFSVPENYSEDFKLRCPSEHFLCEEFKKGKNICPRKLLGHKSGEYNKLCNCNHAEQNAIAFAARHGHSTQDASAFVYPISPCSSCAGLLIAAGIKEVYTTKIYDDRFARIILSEAGVHLFLVNADLLDLDSSSLHLNDENLVINYKE